jgi:thiamine biosynthesis lipoprotein
MGAAPQSNRREFLQGKAAVDALAQFDVGGDAALSADGSAESYLLRLSRRAMACTFEVFLNAGQYPHGTEAALAALDLVAQLEDQLSVYREHSEVTRLNREAAFRPVALEPRLFALLARAVELHAQTAGAFDVTAGRLSEVWGFKQRRGRLPDQEELEAARALVGSDQLDLDAQEQTVRFRRGGLEINLGSIGKGYALDRAAELLIAQGVDDFLLHGGSSSVLARGTHGSPADQPGWFVGLRHPLRPERRIGRLRLVDRALATSGSGTQFFLHQGRRYGHILDPRTGWPASGVLTASVVAATAAEADALATAFYVMGPQAARDYCQQHAGVAAVILCPGQREGSITTHVFGFGPDDWTTLDEA